MTADMYPRPSRETIAAQVRASAAVDGDLDGIVRKHEPETPAPDPLACFSVHLAARMRVLGWDQAELQERAHISAHVAAKAMNGTACELGLAGKLAGLTGGYLAAMIGPYNCSTCAGEPPKGFGCLECGAETRAAS